MFIYRSNYLPYGCVFGRIQKSMTTASGNNPTKFRLRVWDSVWSCSKISHVTKKGALAVGVVCSVTLLIEFADNRVDRIVSAFENGAGIQEFEIADKLADIPRDEIKARLKTLLFPVSSEHYAVIVGGNGSGKSTAIRQALADIKAPRGFVYIDCPPNPRLFSLRLAELIGFEKELGLGETIRRFFRRRTTQYGVLLSEAEPMRTFSAFERVLVQAAKQYQRKHKKPMVLVIDSVDILAEKDPSFLCFLQDFAKNASEIGALRVVFIPPDDSALSLMMGRSAWSRTAKPVFEIGEIPDDEAVRYLMKRGVHAAAAERAVEKVTGGLFTALVDFSVDHAEGKALEEVIDWMDNKTATALNDLGLSPIHPAFQHILTHQSIKSALARDLGLTKKLLDRLVEQNILVAHPNGTFTFYNRRVREWLATMGRAEDVCTGGNNLLDCGVEKGLDNRSSKEVVTAQCS